MLTELTIEQLHTAIPLLLARMQETGMLSKLNCDHAMEKVAHSLQEKYGVVMVDDTEAPQCGIWILSLPSIWFAYPVAYVMGMMALPGARNSNTSRELLTSAEQWARGRGCKELSYASYLQGGPDITPLLEHFGMTAREKQFTKPLN